MPASLPLFRVAKSDLAEILRTGAPSRGVFSCNDRCEIWLATKRGHIHPTDRQYVDIPALDEIAEAVIRAWPLGGRFRITTEGVVLLNGPEALFRFEFV